MIELHQIPKERARSLIQQCFVSLSREVDRTLPPPSQLSDFAIDCTSAGATERTIELFHQIDTGQFGKNVKRLAKELANSAVDDPTAIEPASKQDLLIGAAMALIEQQRYFLHRIEDRFAPYAPKAELFKDISPDDDQQEYCVAKGFVGPPLAAVIALSNGFCDPSGNMVPEDKKAPSAQDRWMCC